VREIYVPDLHIDTLKIKPRNFRSAPHSGDQGMDRSKIDGTGVASAPEDRVVVDVNKMRDLQIALNHLTSADEAYTLYYDETNNIRRLLLTPDGMNNKELKCFALGGIVHTSPDHDFRLKELRAKLHIQPSAPEMKLRHLAKGYFLDIIGATKIETFLEWLLAENLFIHCSVLDPLYWSIVDIVDSVLTAEGNAYLLPGGHNLKSDLYTILMADREGLIEILHRYSYPNVGAAREAFMRELQDLVEAREDMLDHFNYQMLKGVLQMGRKHSTLTYLEKETPNVLIDELSGFFINRICILKNTTHIFDKEDWIEGILSGMSFRDDDKEMDNFRFVHSENYPGIQLSDVAIGLLGKYFTFLNSTDWETLEFAKDTLNERQRNNIARLNTLIDKSIAENPIFFHSVLCIDDHRKSEFFLEG
jgi:hypothetical protein